MLLFPLDRTLEVGPGKPYTTIQSAVDAAGPGDRIEVLPSPDHYAGEHVRIAKPNLQIEGDPHYRTLIDGKDFDYSGEGKIPRAIFEFEPGSENSKLSFFELTGAHNQSFNGAGVRINQASKITIYSCTIHDNDMGIMSNGAPGSTTAASDQLISDCAILRNGNEKDPGQNHNLYLGGTSVTVLRCNIFGSLTGHNLKSRAHFNDIENCYIHDAKNRELDLVESEDTARPNSNAVLIDNLIVKSPAAENGQTIHFGAERGVHNGTLYMINNTVVSWSVAPLLSLDSTQASLYDNILVNRGQAHPLFLSPNAGVVKGSNNWISLAYRLPATLVDGWQEKESPFLDEQNLNLLPRIQALKPTQPYYVDGLGVKKSAPKAGVGCSFDLSLMPAK